MDYYTQLKQEIVSKLKEKGYSNKLITYQEFQNLYQEYGKEMTELQFAGLLGVRASNYNSTKHKGTRMRILKGQEISKERQEEIIRNLKEKGYSNKAITYQEFQELYEEYGKEMTEVQFASLLGITDGNYRSAKYTGTRMRILKGQEMLEERREEIVSKLKEKGYRNKAIAYQEFQELHQEYGKEMTEVQFAGILGVRASNYKNAKYKGKRIRILKEEKVSKERREEIVKSLKEKGYSNKAITYQEFQELYKEYGKEITEVQFVGILGVTETNYKNAKRGRRIRILKREEVPEEIRKEVVSKIDKKGYSNKAITYQEFQELHQEYGKEMTEAQFAHLLGVTESSYKAAKKGQRMRVLKGREISKERQEEIVRKLKKKGYSNKLITYQQFQELYEEYGKEMTEVQFANLLGVTEGNYQTAKNKGQRIRINFEKDQLDIVRHVLQKSRYYEKEELQKICVKVGIPLEKVILAISGYNEEVATRNENAIKQKNRLYIGRTPISNEFLNKHIEELFSYCKDTSNKLGKKYRLTRLQEDIASEVLLNVIQKQGNVVYNYSEEEAIDALKGICYINIKYGYLNSLRVKVLQSIDGKSDDRDKAYISQRWLRDKKTNVEQTAMKNHEQKQTIKAIDIKDEEELYQFCISVINECHEKGMDHTEYISEVCKRTGIEYNKLLEIMKRYLVEQNRVRKTRNGEYIRGEER